MSALFILMPPEVGYYVSVCMLMHVFLRVCRNTRHGKCIKAKGQPQVLFLTFHLVGDRVSLFFIALYTALADWGSGDPSISPSHLTSQALELQTCASKPGFVWVLEPSACAANTVPLNLLTKSSSLRANDLKEFNLFTKTVGCGSACF